MFHQRPDLLKHLGPGGKSACRFFARSAFGLMSMARRLAATPNRTFWPRRTNGKAELIIGDEPTSIRAFFLVDNTTLTVAGCNALTQRSQYLPKQGMMSIFSPAFPGTTALDTAYPSCQRKRPTGQSSYSCDHADCREPGSRAAALISMIPSINFRQFCAKNARMNQDGPRDRKICVRGFRGAHRESVNGRDHQPGQLARDLLVAANYALSAAAQIDDHMAKISTDFTTPVMISSATFL